MKTEKLRELLDQRDAIDEQIVAIVTDGSQKQRAPKKCSKCGAEGHTAKTCPQGQLAT